MPTNDLSKYYSDVRAMAASLPPAPVYYVTSLDTGDREGKPGRVMDMSSARLAAERIVGRTHRLSTEPEIEAFKAGLITAAKDLAAIEQDRKGQLAMPKDMTDLVKVILRREERDAANDAADKEKRSHNK